MIVIKIILNRRSTIEKGNCTRFYNHDSWHLETNNCTGHKVARCVVMNINTDTVAIEFEVIRIQTIIEAAMIMNDT